MFGSRQQSFKQSRFLRGAGGNDNSNDKLSRPKRNNTVVPRRLSPLKENSPSKPPPISTEFLVTENNAKYQPSTSTNNTKRINNHQNHTNTTTRRVQQQQQQPTLSSPGFSQLEVQELHESFQLFDIDNTGRISVGDLRSILQTIQSERTQPQQQPLSYPYLDKLLHQMANWGDEDELTLDEYINLMASTTISSAMMQRQQHSSNGDVFDRDNGDLHDYAHVFRLFDLDGKGYIDLQDLERVALELGEHDITREELQEMIERAISNTKHTQQQQYRVSLKEFTRMMTMNLFPPKRDEQQQQSN